MGGDAAGRALLRGGQHGHPLFSAVDSVWHKAGGSPRTPAGVSGGSLVALGSGATVPTLSSAGSSSTIPELPFGSGILTRTEFTIDTGA